MCVCVGVHVNYLCMHLSNVDRQRQIFRKTFCRPEIETDTESMGNSEMWCINVNASKCQRYSFAILHINHDFQCVIYFIAVLKLG